jgi:3-deoxy-D-manno-octulosonic-acid transferase
MIKTLYDGLMWGLQPLLKRKLAQRAVREPGYAQAVPERFGHYDTAPWSAQPPCIWVHAVSLGETRAAALLLPGLRQRWPGVRLLLSHGTATGRAEGRALLLEGDAQVWLPWDTSAAVNAFLQHFKPRLGVLMETEVWPNLVAACRQAKVPLVLANARMNTHSLRRAQRIPSLSRPAFAGLSAVWAQSQDDADRLVQLGAPVQGVFGNIKFDARPQPEQLAQGRQWRAANQRPVIMFASSREGEEDEWLAMRKAQAQRADVQWLIVPRHPQRFAEVAQLIQAQGLSLSRRSEWTDQPVAADVWLGDSLGEMALYYGMSDAALLGGSFAPLGGQNLIEAAACDCPVFMGPHTFNFKEAARLAQAAGAAQACASLAAAMLAAEQLVRDAAARQAMADAARQFALAHRGATDRTLEALAELLGQQGVDAL